MEQTTAISSQDADVDEGVEIVRVKLLRAGGSAVVGELRAADLLLARWAASGSVEKTLGFEITFDDGQALCGCYEYGRAKKCKQPFSRFMRNIFKGLQQTPAIWPKGTYFLALPPSDSVRHGIGHGSVRA